MTNQAALIFSKTTNRLLVLILSVTTAVLVLQAFVGPPSAYALDTTTDRPDSGTWNAAGTVFATALSEDGGTLYIGGKFTRVRENPPGIPGDSVEVSNVAAIDVATGAALKSWTPQVTGTDEHPAIVRSLAVKDGKVYIGGNFAAVGGEPRQNLAAVDATDGSVDPYFAPNVSKTTKTPWVYALRAGDSRLYAGGSFNKVDGKGRANLAAFNLATGALDNAWKPKANNKVRDFEFASDGETVFVAGRFTNITGSDGAAGRRESVARLHTDTGNLHPWKIRDGVIGAPQDGWDLTVTPTMVYGGFGAGPNFAAAFRLSPDPLLDGTQAWRFNTVGNVQTVELSSNGTRLFLGGHFGTNRLEQSICGGTQQLSGLVSVDPRTGQPFCDWVPQLAPSVENGNGAWAMSVTDAYLWVGGGFTHVSGVDQRNIARFTL
jgi:hypothetical protein